MRNLTQFFFTEQELLGEENKDKNKTLYNLELMKAQPNAHRMIGMAIKDIKKALFHLSQRVESVMLLLLWDGIIDKIVNQTNDLTDNQAAFYINAVDQLMSTHLLNAALDKYIRKDEKGKNAEYYIAPDRGMLEHANRLASKLECK